MVSFPMARFAWSVLASIMLLGAGGTAAVDWHVYVGPQRLVDVGGRRINLYCAGEGAPTVLLGNDGDDSIVGWRFVQSAVAHVTRVCSYDSPGLGFSDPAPAPRDAATEMHEMRALLAHAGIATPIVLVGYGESGFAARLYADHYPNEIAGMVLVSPQVPNQDEREAAIVPALNAAFAQRGSFDDMCLRAAEDGTMRPGAPAFAQCMYAPPGTDLPKAIVSMIQHQWQQPGLWRDFTAIDRAQSASSSEVIRAQRRYGSMPLIVLTSDIYAEHLPFPPGQMRALAAAWKQWRDEIAAFSSHGTNFVVAGATTNVAIDRPASVVSAIDEIIDQMRAR